MVAGEVAVVAVAMTGGVNDNCDDRRGADCVRHTGCLVAYNRLN